MKGRDDLAARRRASAIVRRTTADSSESGPDPILQTPTVSGSLAAIYGVVGALVVLAVTTIGVAIALAAVAGSSLTLAIALLRREAPLPRAVGSTILPLSPMALLLALLLVTRGVTTPTEGAPQVALVVFTTTAIYGATGALVGSVGVEATGRALESIVIVVIPPLVALGVLGARILEYSSPSLEGVEPAIEAGRALVFAAEMPASADTFGLNAAVVGLLAACAALALRGAVGRVPVVELAPGDRRDRFRRARRGIRRALSRVALWAFVGAVGFATFAIAQYERDLLASVPYDFSVLYALSVSTALRRALVWITLASLATVLAVVAIRLVVRSSLPRRLGEISPQLLGGFVLIAVGTIVHDRYALTLFGMFAEESLVAAYREEALGDLGQAVVLGALVLTLVGVALALLVLAVAWALGFYRDRAAPAAVAAASLVGCAIALALVGTSFAWVLAVLALGILTWDVATFGVRLFDEVAYGSGSATLELSHALSAAVVAGVGIVAATLGSRVLEPATVTGSPAVLVAVVAGVVGTILLVALLEG